MKASNDSSSEPGARTCTEPGCNRPIKIKARALCAYHYAKLRAESIEAGTWDPSPRPLRGRCKHPYCRQPAAARGLCQRHYQAARQKAIREGSWTRDG